MGCSDYLGRKKIILSLIPDNFENYGAICFHFDFAILRKWMVSEIKQMPLKSFVVVEIKEK